MQSVKLNTDILLGSIKHLLGVLCQLLTQIKYPHFVGFICAHVHKYAAQTRLEMRIFNLSWKQVLISVLKYCMLIISQPFILSLLRTLYFLLLNLGRGVVACLFLTNLSLASEDKIIAITEIVEHPSLVQAKLGIIDALKSGGFEEGKNLKIINKNAQGSIANAILIAKQFVQMKPDAIVPISTLSTQSVIKEVGDSGVPVVFSSVSDPVSAGIVLNLESVKQGVTGAMDYPLIKKEIELIKEYIPNIKVIGFLYSTGEANSVKTIELMKKMLDGKIEYIDSQVASSHQVGQAILSLAGRVDAIYVPSDNVVFSAMPKLVQMSRKYKIPMFSSDPDSVKSGIFACVGYTQYEVGRSAGSLLVRVLNGEKDLKIEKPIKEQIFLNKKTAGILGFEVLDEIMGTRTDIVGIE